MEHVSVDDVSIPALGLGTWQMEGEECEDAVESALERGYRHIDTAQMYGNEAAVGAAIERADIDREEVFLVTKVRRKNLAPKDVRRTVTASLDRLGTWIDLLLIHSPNETVPLEDSFAAMNEFRDGRVRHLGVSNFSVEQLHEVMAVSEAPILTNQVEYNVFERQDDLLSFCLEEECMLTAYSPVARRDVVGDETLAEIGGRYGKTEAQVALRWLIQQEPVSAIPKAASPAHQAENLDVFDFELTDAEMRRIFEIGGEIDPDLAAKLGIV